MSIPHTLASSVPTAADLAALCEALATIPPETDRRRFFPLPLSGRGGKLSLVNLRVVVDHPEFLTLWELQERVFSAVAEVKAATAALWVNPTKNIPTPTPPALAAAEAAAEAAEKAAWQTRLRLEEALGLLEDEEALARIAGRALAPRTAEKAALRAAITAAEAEEKAASAAASEARAASAAASAAARPPASAEAHERVRAAHAARRAAIAEYRRIANNSVLSRFIWIEPREERL